MTLDDPMIWLAMLFLVLVGVYRLIRAWRHGIVEVLSRDEMTLRSSTLGLSGRPDRLVRLRNGAVIPIEKKSSKHLRDSHRVQLGAYFLLIEEAYGRRPPFGVLVLGNNREIKVQNTAHLRRWTRRVADQVRDQRREPGKVPRISRNPRRCQSCGFRDSCEIRSTGIWHGIRR